MVTSFLREEIRFAGIIVLPREMLQIAHHGLRQNDPLQKALINIDLKRPGQLSKIAQRVLNRDHAIVQISGLNRYDLEAELAIDGFMNPFKAQRFFEAYPACFSGAAKAEVPDEKHLPLKDVSRPDALKFAQQRRGRRRCQVGRSPARLCISRNGHETVSTQTHCSCEAAAVSADRQLRR